MKRDVRRPATLNNTPRSAPDEDKCRPSTPPQQRSYQSYLISSDCIATDRILSEPSASRVRREVTLLAVAAARQNALSCPTGRSHGKLGRFTVAT